jgi:hypothetical protein
MIFLNLIFSKVWLNFFLWDPHKKNNKKTCKFLCLYFKRIVPKKNQSHLTSLSKTHIKIIFNIIITNIF